MDHVYQLDKIGPIKTGVLFKMHLLDIRCLEQKGFGSLGFGLDSTTKTRAPREFG